MYAGLLASLTPADRKQAADILTIIVLVLAGAIILSVAWDHFKKGRH